MKRILLTLILAMSFGTALPAQEVPINFLETESCAELVPCSDLFWWTDCYFAVKGSLNFYHPEHSSTYYVHPHLGAFMAAAQGATFGNRWRLEAELGVRYNNPKSYHIHDGMGTHKVRGYYYKFFSVMANAYYDFPCICDVRPYVGFGSGVALEMVHLKFQKEIIRKHRHGWVAWQVMAGFLHHVACGLHLGVEYRYFGAHPDAQTHDVGVVMQYHY